LNSTLKTCPLRRLRRTWGVSKNSVYGWRGKGILLDNDLSWKEYRDKRNNMAKAKVEGQELQVLKERKDQFWTEEQDKIKDAMDQFTEELRDGNVEMNVTDYQALYKTLLKMQNRGEELRRHMKRFRKKIYAAAFDVVGADKAERIKDKVKEIEQQIMQEFDPQVAKAMLDEGDNINVE